MLLTQTDLINMKISTESKINNSQIIKDLIENHISSSSRKNMLLGENYYDGEHQILEKDFRSEILFSTDNLGNEKKEFFSNANRSNHKNVHTFHTILVDQKAAYITGKEPTITIDGAESDLYLKEYENIVSKFCDENFNATIHDLIVGASNKGIEFLHFFYDSNGALQYTIVPASQCIAIYDEQYQNEIKEMIRYYYITAVDGDKKTIRKKVEWWNENTVTYFTENKNGDFLLDTSFEYNPMPHFFEVSIDKFDKNIKEHSWGRVPFVMLENNARRVNDLQKIKGLIDAYDIVSSQGTNDLIDLVALYWCIQGYGGETASQIARKLRLNRAVSISDSAGSIDAKQVDLPIEGRLEWLKFLRRDIFNFGMGIDTDNEVFGSASGVSLKFRYTQLDLKANAMIPKLKKAIRDIIWFFTQDYNNKHNTNFDPSLVRITINKTMITNESEIVQILQNSTDMISSKTLLKYHPYVDDANQEIKEISQEKLDKQIL